MYQLHFYIKEENLYGEWRALEKELYSYEVYEKEHYITHEFWGRLYQPFLAEKL